MTNEFNRKVHKIFSIIIILLVVVSCAIAVAISLKIPRDKDTSGFFQYHGGGLEFYYNTWEMIDKFCILAENNTSKMISVQRDMESCNRSPFRANFTLNSIFFTCVMLILPFIICRMVAIYSYTTTHSFYSIFILSCAILYIFLFTIYLFWMCSPYENIIYTNKMGGHMQGYWLNNTLIQSVNHTFDTSDSYVNYYCDSMKYMFTELPVIPGYLNITEIKKCTFSINIKPVMYLFVAILFLIVELIYFATEYKVLKDYEIKMNLLTENSLIQTK